jgi:hypothetical protein
MKQKIILFFCIFFLSFLLVKAQSLLPIELTSEFGPPANPDTWEKFTILITAEAFNTDSVTMITALESVTSFRIRTEMHTGYDVGGVDNVVIGTMYASNFDASIEGWSSGGDGTLEWMSTGGVSGGYIQISDWATGDLSVSLSSSDNSCIIVPSSVVVTAGFDFFTLV